jgi:hypothetical protein
MPAWHEGQVKRGAYGAIREHLPADRIKSGFAAGTYGCDLAGGDSGRDLKIGGAYGATRNSQRPERW